MKHVGDTGSIYVKHAPIWETPRRLSSNFSGVQKHRRFPPEAMLIEIEACTIAPQLTFSDPEAIPGKEICKINFQAAIKSAASAASPKTNTQESRGA